MNHRDCNSVDKSEWMRANKPIDSVASKCVGEHMHVWNVDRDHESVRCVLERETEPVEVGLCVYLPTL